MKNRENYSSIFTISDNFKLFDYSGNNLLYGKIDTNNNH